MNEKTRNRLIEQGFTGLDDAVLDVVGPWLRVGPGVCAVVTLIGTAAGSPAILWGLVPVATITAVTRKHPADWFYDLVIRPLKGRQRRLPVYGAPRRFSAGLAGAWLVATGQAFHFGANVLGIGLGLFLGLALGLAALTDICTGCIMYHRLRKLELPNEPVTAGKWTDSTEPRFRIGGRSSRTSYS